MEQQVIKILEEKHGYDFSSEFFTDEVKVIISETINATFQHIQETFTITKKCNHDFVKSVAYKGAEVCSKCNTYR